MHSVNQNKIIVVPISEMVDVFAMEPGLKAKPKPGEFARVKFGLYKDDLAQIISIEEHIGKVVVRIVPRLESTGNKKIRPPGKLFNPIEYPNADKKRDPNTQEVYYTYQSNHFSNGFILKTLAFRSLNFVDTRPTLSEIKIFDDSQISMVLKPKKVSFVQGDKIRVLYGDSKGLTGTVESSNSSTVTMYPFIAELCDKKLEFPISELCKFFEIGDHVKVIEGRYSGITGMIVANSDNNVDIISDITKTVITVLSDDLKLSEEISSGQGKTENFNLNEIVLLKNEINFGIITKLNAGGVTVVLDDGETTSVWYHEISRKFSPHKFTAIDRDQNKLFFNDMVKIVYAKHPFFSKFGSVKNAFRGVLFVKVQDNLETLMVSAKASYCLLQGQKVVQDPCLRHDFRNVMIRLKSGPYRGNTGKVIEVIESKFKVQLSANSKVITIDNSACEKIENDHDLMAFQEVTVKKTPAIHSPAYTPHDVASPWDIRDTPSHRRY